VEPYLSQRQWVPSPKEADMKSLSIARLRSPDPVGKIYELPKRNGFRASRPTVSSNCGTNAWVLTRST